MMLATPFNLFAIFAFSAFSLDHSALVFANNKNDDTSLPTNPTMSDHPTEDMAASMSDQRRAGHLSLLGLDPRIPLTKDEAAFLEATLRDVFNKVHKNEGIDLVADTVAIVGQEFVEDTTDNNNNLSNLRGSDRKLRPTTDIERCFHDPWGPLKGQVIEDCDYDIEFILDGIYCDLCDDGYYDFVDDKLWERWDDVFDQPDVYINDDVFYQYHDDDYYWNYVATPAPSVSMAPSAAPTTAPSPSPTSAPTENKDVDIETERGPQQPPMDPISWQILYQLHHSPFKSFHRVHRIKFGGW